MLEDNNLETDEIQSIENDPDELTNSIKDAFEKAGFEVNRDDKGRFAKTDDELENTTDDAVKADVEIPAEATTSDLKVEDKPQEQTEQINAPISWKSELKDKWATLPPDVKAEIARREKEVHQGFTKLDEERNFGKQMRDSISPFMATIQSTGVQPHVAVGELLKTDHLLRYGTLQQKEQALQGIMSYYNVTANPDSQQQQTLDPAVQSLQQQVQQLTGFIQSQQNQTAQQQESQRLNTVNQFIQSKQLNDVTDEFLSHIQVNRNLHPNLSDMEVLEKAHESYIWANPDTRASLIAKQQTDADAKRLSDIKNKSSAARSAAVSITGSPSGTQNTLNPTDTVEAELNRQFQKAGFV